MAARRKKPAPKKVGVVGQVRQSLRKGSRLATALGFLWGGWVPVGSYVVCHKELPGTSGAHFAALCLFVLGGLLFSAKTVWLWSAAAFQDRWKASGFVLLLEGVMVLSQVPGLAWSALAILVLINGVATGTTLARGK